MLSLTNGPLPLDSVCRRMGIFFPGSAGSSVRNDVELSTERQFGCSIRERTCILISRTLWPPCSYGRVITKV